MSIGTYFPGTIHIRIKKMLYYKQSQVNIKIIFPGKICSKNLKIFLSDEQETEVKDVCEKLKNKHEIRME